MPTLKNISIYPVKSLRGHDAAQVNVERMGLENDRRLMVVDPEGMFLTQREHARMALIEPVLKNRRLTLSAPGAAALTIALTNTGQPINVEIWSSSGVKAVDQGESAAKWLSDFLQMPARLVEMEHGYQRKVSADYAVRADDHVSFADGFPILIVSQESLDDLNSRMEQPIPMNRFRPNLVVSGTSPFAEDGWRRIRIGGVELALVKPCARCNVPGINQDTAEAGKEPNATLAKYRKINGKVMFGVNVIPLTTGRLSVGDTVEIIE